MAPGEDDGELSCKKGLRMKRFPKRQGRGVCPHGDPLGFKISLSLLGLSIGSGTFANCGRERVGEIFHGGETGLFCDF
jgi:hypothetical protein